MSIDSLSSDGITAVFPLTFKTLIIQFPQGHVTSFPFSMCCSCIVFHVRYSKQYQQLGSTVCLSYCWNSSQNIAPSTRPSFTLVHTPLWGLPDGTMVRNLPANEGDRGDKDLICGLEKSPGVGNGNTLQYTCLENSMDRRSWWARVHGVSKSQVQLSAAQHSL